MFDFFIETWRDLLQFLLLRCWLTVRAMHKRGWQLGLCGALTVPVSPTFSGLLNQLSSRNVVVRLCMAAC